MLTCKDRAALRKIANSLDTILQVGKGRIGEQIDDLRPFNSKE